MEDPASVHVFQSRQLPKRVEKIYSSAWGKNTKRATQANSLLASQYTTRFSDPSYSCSTSKTTNVSSSRVGPLRGSSTTHHRLIPIMSAFRVRLVRSGKNT